MHIDPKGMIAGKPAMLVRDYLRKLRVRASWDLAALEKAACLTPGSGRSLLRALARAGLVERVDRNSWEITQAGQTLSSATAAKPISRTTAEKALDEFMERVARVNQDARFLGSVNRVVLFGSLLRKDVDRLSDVDVAVEVVPNIVDREQHATENRRRVEALARAGHIFRDIFDVHLHWHREVFRFLKARSRVISLADYKAEKAFILAVPHRMLIGTDEEPPAQPVPEPKPRLKSPRGPRDCPF
jgi:predicted nucleotidyltransferase